MPGTTSIRSWTRTRACAAPRSWVGSLLLPVLMLLEWSPLAAGWGGGGGIRGLAGGSSGLRLLLIAGSCVRAQLPRAPTTLAVPYVRESSIALEWEAVEGAQAYRVWSQYEEGGAAFSVFKDIFAAPFSAPSNSTVLTGLIYGRPLYLKIASGTAEGVFDAGSSPVVRATPLAPPEQAVQSVSLVSYGAQSVTLSWGLAGASTTTSAGPPASVFAILYSCTASNTVEKLYPPPPGSHPCLLNPRTHLPFRSLPAPPSLPPLSLLPRMGPHAMTVLTAFFWLVFRENRLALSHSGFPIILKLIFCVCGTNPSTLRRKRAHQIGEPE